MRPAAEKALSRIGEGGALGAEKKPRSTPPRHSLRPAKVAATALSEPLPLPQLPKRCDERSLTGDSPRHSFWARAPQFNREAWRVRKSGSTRKAMPPNRPSKRNQPPPASYRWKQAKCLVRIQSPCTVLPRDDWQAPLGMPSGTRQTSRWLWSSLIIVLRDIWPIPNGTRGSRGFEAG